MWDDLPIGDKNEYRDMILAFASLTEMFAQKEENDVVPAPIINSKYQETVFQKVFGAFAEDIGNTSYDASLVHPVTKRKYLIGIKTFGVYSRVQKIAQFKTNHDDWAEILETIRVNSLNPDGSYETRDDVNESNKQLYLELARNIATLRNKRIDSSVSNIRGFKIVEGDWLESVYHVLMPSRKGDKPSVYVGETSYDHIDIEAIRIIGCTRPDNPTNFDFTDGHHKYKFTSADSQLHMDFNNSDIIVEQWDVKYADNAYDIFKQISYSIYADARLSEELDVSYCWKITDGNGEVEPFSGFNSFYGVGSKKSMSDRGPYVDRLYQEFDGTVESEKLEKITAMLRSFLLDRSEDRAKLDKIRLRNEIVAVLEHVDNDDFKKRVQHDLFRPVDELYIPIPNAKTFHRLHPDFFVEGLGSRDLSCMKDIPKDERTFTLVFEPSGDTVSSYITQTNGKGISSRESQSILGNWILRNIFQLREYEPLTGKRLEEIEINGIRLYKLKGKPEIHLQFVWIDDKHLPDDYIG